MLDLFRNMRISRHVKGARAYLKCTYCPPVEESGVKFSGRGGDVKFSGRDQGARYSGHEVDRYSIDEDGITGSGDLFCHERVQQLLSMHSTAPAELTQQLEKTLNLTFVDMLTRYINLKGWRDSRVYKAAQLDRRLFSKLMSDRNYKPSKDTALALAIALELSPQQTTDLLERAGYTLSHSSKRDVIIEYCVREGIFDLTDVNGVLYELGQKTIGR